jgi:hypothetical protein
MLEAIDVLHAGRNTGGTVCILAVFIGVEGQQMAVPAAAGPVAEKKRPERLGG